ncbi:unnamed protein product, partial [marine sediment metagenome]
MPDDKTRKKVTKKSLPNEVKISVEASLAKKGEGLVVLDLRMI